MSFRYNRIFKPLRRIAKSVLSFVFPVVTKIWRLPRVASIDETLDKINYDKCSIARFGDGEFLFVLDKLDLPFQEYNEALSEKLKKILVSSSSNILIGLPSGYHSMRNMNYESRLMWRSHLSWTYPRVSRLLNLKKEYYNASFTRFYYELENKTDSKRYISKIKEIWKDREILIVEGEKSRLGVGNDLFANTASVVRILAPKHHAFRRYEDLLNAAVDHGKDKLVLLALGPTATALSFDMAQRGFQVIDIGNVDIEYEWFLSNSIEKVVVKGKYTSEAVGGREVEDISDPYYESQIILRIL